MFLYKKRLAGAASLIAPVATPFIINGLLNRIVSWLFGYKVSFEHVSVSWVSQRPMLTIEDVSIGSMAHPTDRPFFEADRVTFKMRWGDALKGKMTAEMEVLRPALVLNAVTYRTELQLQSISHQRMASFPLKLERIMVEGGRLSVEAIGGEDGLNADISDIQADIRNFSLNRHAAASTKTVFDATGFFTSSGSVRVQGDVVPFSQHPTFSVNAELHQVDLADLNSLIRRVAGVHVQAGSLNMYAQVSSAAGLVHGYVKPIASGLEMDKVDVDESVRTRGLLVRFLAHLLRNRQNGQIATRIDFAGHLSDPSISVSDAVVSALKNAFVRTMSDGFEAETIPARPYSFRLIRGTFERWAREDIARLGASLSFYTAFSLAPMLVLLTAAAGYIFGRDAVQGHLRSQLVSFMGAQSAVTIESMIQAARRPVSGTYAAVASAVVLLVGASSVMVELKSALNKIWNVGGRTGIKSVIENKIFSFGMILAVGFLLLVSLVFSAVLSAIGKFFGGLLPFPELVFHTLDIVFSIGITALLFAMIFKFLPDTDVDWHDVWVGAGLTAILFTLGKILLGFYLGRGAIASMYGAAGSVLVMLLWVYYSAQILFFGAAFTKVHSSLNADISSV